MFLLLVLFHVVFPLRVCHTFHSCPTGLGYSVLFYFSVFLLFSFGSFHCHILRLRDSLLRHVYATKDPIKSIHFHYNVSDLYHFFLILPQRPNLLLT